MVFVGVVFVDKLFVGALAWSSVSYAHRSCQSVALGFLDGGVAQGSERGSHNP